MIRRVSPEIAEMHDGVQIQRDKIDTFALPSTYSAETVRMLAHQACRVHEAYCADTDFNQRVCPANRAYAFATCADVETTLRQMGVDYRHADRVQTLGEEILDYKPTKEKPTLPELN